MARPCCRKRLAVGMASYSAGLDNVPPVSTPAALLHEESIDMIRFNCHQCGRPFTVRDQDAGRRAKCKKCGADVTVPAANDSAAQTPTADTAHASAAAESQGSTVGAQGTSTAIAPMTAPRIPM